MNKLTDDTPLDDPAKCNISSEEKSLPTNTLCRMYWEATRDLQIPTDTSVRMFKEIKRMMAKSESKKTNFLIHHWLQCAASVLLLIGTAFSIYFYRQNYSSAKTLQAETKEYAVSAAKGKKLSMILPDGTKIWLNSYTKITYTSDYGVNDRTLSLTGEACFEVAKDTAKRFLVKAGEMEIEVFGTTFNVKAYNEDNQIVTTLLTGEVQATVAGQTIRLAPDQSVFFNRKNKQVFVDNSEYADNALMWRKGELVFKNQTMEEIAVILNRLYDVEIVFESETIKKHSFSGVVKHSLKDVLETIGMTSYISYEITANRKIILREKTNSK